MKSYLTLVSCKCQGAWSAAKIDELELELDVPVLQAQVPQVCHHQYRDNRLAMDGDALDRELASLADTINVSNPITFGHKSTWRSTQKDTELAAKQESEFAKTLPRHFILTEPQNAKKDFAVVAAAARNPVQPLRPSLLLNEDGSRSNSNASTSGDVPSRAALSTPSSRVPIAKRSHMDGVLRGIPGGSELLYSTQQRAFVYDGEMNNMNQDKDTRHHRKRDAYSDYVEARARFSKMHSVN